MCCMTKCRRRAAASCSIVRRSAVVVVRFEVIALIVFLGPALLARLPSNPVMDSWSCQERVWVLAWGPRTNANRCEKPSKATDRQPTDPSRQQCAG